MKKYLVIYEWGAPNEWSAYSPDLPGCVAAGSSRQEVEALMREAIPFHLDGLRAAEQSIPQPSTAAGYVDC